jgi:hypothetical protein
MFAKLEAYYMINSFASPVYVRGLFNIISLCSKGFF